MKLEFDLNAHTALGILEALEVFTSHHKRPKDPEDESHFEQLSMLRDAFRVYAVDIREACSTRNPEIWFVP